MSILKSLALAGTMALVGGIASAGTTIGTLGTLTTPFAVGTGNSSNNFFIATGPDGLEIGIKAKERKVGELNVVDGAYQTVAGSVQDTVGGQPTTLAIWSVDWSINLGTKPGLTTTSF